MNVLQYIYQTVFSQYVKVGGDLLKVGGDSSSAKRCGAATPRRGGHGRGFPPPIGGKFLQKWKSNTAIWCILRDNFMFHHWFFTGIDEQVCFNVSPKQKLERCTIYIFNEWLILCTNSNWQSYQNLKLEGTCFTAPKAHMAGQVLLNYSNRHDKNIIWMPQYNPFEP